MCVQDSNVLTYLHHLTECDSTRKTKKKKFKKSEGGHGDERGFKLFSVKRAFVAFFKSPVLNSKLVLCFPLCLYKLSLHNCPPPPVSESALI